MGGRLPVRRPLGPRQSLRLAPTAISEKRGRGGQGSPGISEAAPTVKSSFYRTRNADLAVLASVIFVMPYLH